MICFHICFHNPGSLGQPAGVSPNRELMLPDPQHRPDRTWDDLDREGGIGRGRRWPGGRGAASREGPPPQVAGGWDTTALGRESYNQTVIFCMQNCGFRLREVHIAVMPKDTRTKPVTASRQPSEAGNLSC